MLGVSRWKKIWGSASNLRMQVMQSLSPDPRQSDRLGQTKNVTLKRAFCTANVIMEAACDGHEKVMKQLISNVA